MRYLGTRSKPHCLTSPSTPTATDDTIPSINAGNSHPLVDGDAATDPAIITHQWEDASGYLIVSTWGGGVYIINTQNTPGTDDDTLVKRYYDGSSPPLASNFVYHTWLATAAPFTNQLYVSTTGGVSIISIGVVSNAGDDTPAPIGVYSDTPSPAGTPDISTNDTRHSMHATVSAGVVYLFASTDSGLVSIDTINSAPTNTDVIRCTYGTAQAAFGTNDVRHSIYYNGYVYASTNLGLKAINLNGTPSNCADDTISTHPLVGVTVPTNSIWINTTNNTMYVSTDNGLIDIDTKGTGVVTDDTLIYTYSTTSNPSYPQLGDNEVYYVYLDTSNQYLYVYTDLITRPIGRTVPLPPGQVTIVPRPTTYYYPDVS